MSYYLVEHLTKEIGTILFSSGSHWSLVKIISLEGQTALGKTMLMRAGLGLIKPTQGCFYWKTKALDDIDFPLSVGLPGETGTSAHIWL